MKHLTILICALFCALACGGESYDEAVDLDALRAEAEDDAEEFSDLEQAIIAESTFGFRTDLSLPSNSNTRCLAVPPASQVCNLPNDRSVTFRATGQGMSAAQKADVEAKITAAVNSWDNQFPSWSLALSTLAEAADVNIRFSSLNSGNASTSIHRYAHVTSIGGNNIPDPILGVYRVHTPVQCAIDNTRINSDFLPQERPRVLQHAVLYCMTKGIGLGSGAGGVARPDAIAVTKGALKTLNFSNYSKCLVNAYDPASGDVFLTQSCSGQTDN